MLTNPNMTNDQGYPESFKELSQVYKAKALERVSSNKPKKEKEVPQMMMVCNSLHGYMHSCIDDFAGLFFPFDTIFPSVP